MSVTIPSLGISIDHLTRADKRAVEAELDRLLEKPGAAVPNHEAITGAFRLGLKRAPKVNPSDLWHHIVYRHYIAVIRELRPKVKDAGNSWVKSSGTAFQVFVRDYYNPRLAKHGIKLRSLTKADAGNALARMGLSKALRPAKLALIAERGSAVIGVLFVKTSMAERIMGSSDASEQIMNSGCFTAFVTLDVKSYPDKDYVNRGEFGTPSEPTDKRRLIEQSGRYHLCVSYNHRTVPSPKTTLSGRSIVVPRLGQARADRLERELRQR